VASPVAEQEGGGGLEGNRSTRRRQDAKDERCEVGCRPREAVGAWGPGRPGHHEGQEGHGEEMGRNVGIGVVRVDRVGRRGYGGANLSGKERLGCRIQVGMQP